VSMNGTPSSWVVRSVHRAYAGSEQPNRRESDRVSQECSTEMRARDVRVWTPFGTSAGIEASSTPDFSRTHSDAAEHRPVRLTGSQDHQMHGTKEDVPHARTQGAVARLA
jgi:hypothetical protein